MKTFNLKISALIIIFVAFLLMAFAFTAHANPFYTGTKAQTSSATTTPAYLSPGIATSTLVYDSYEQNGTNQPNSDNVTLPNVVAVALQGNASSTLTTIAIACEFSDNNIDWYQNEIYPASSTGALNLSVPATFSFVFSSTTVDGIQISPSRYQKLFECPVPLRYVRAVITDTGAGASVWATIIPTKQRN